MPLSSSSSPLAANWSCLEKQRIFEKADGRRAISLVGPAASRSQRGPLPPPPPPHSVHAQVTAATVRDDSGARAVRACRSRTATGRPQGGSDSVSVGRRRATVHPSRPDSGGPARDCQLAPAWLARPLARDETTSPLRPRSCHSAKLWRRRRRSLPARNLHPGGDCAGGQLALRCKHAQSERS